MKSPSLFRCVLSAVGLLILLVYHVCQSGTGALAVPPRFEEQELGLFYANILTSGKRLCQDHYLWQLFG